jgi:tetratricopeptide (TPR) repeat protein
MIRQLSILTLVTVLFGSVQPGHAQPRPSPPTSQAVLDEADRLDKQVEKLYRERKFGEAIPLAERTLDIREKALGAMHPDVAESLSNLAQLYQSQGAHAKAEPLYVRALDIREKALGLMHPDVAQSLNSLGEFYSDQGAYAKAEPLLVRALDIREKALGPMHPDVANSLNNLGELYLAKGAYPKAEPLLVRALDIHEKALGPMHPDLAHILDNLAELYRAGGAYPKAEPLLVRALNIREKALGPAHPDVANTLNKVAELYHDQGAYPKAESLYIRALGIREKALGPMHPDVAESLNNLAVLYQDQGLYPKAEPLLVRALDIREKSLGPVHPEVAQSLNNLAGLYQDQGAFAKAEPLYLRCLHIREKALGPMHPDFATTLGNVALLYHLQGEDAKAEPLLVRALDIREKVLGPMHPEVVTSLLSLGGHYYTQGAYAKAEPLLVRARNICEKTLGPMHPCVVISLSNLAMLYYVQGAYAKAEPLFVRARDIAEKTLGSMHRYVATSLNNLATFYRDQGAYAKAEPLFLRALDITEKALGPMHPEVARSLNNLAALYQAQGAYAKAEPLFVRALDICEKTLGPMHPDVARSLRSLAVFYQAQGAYLKVEPLLSRAADIREAQLHSSLSPLSESRKRAIMTLIQGETESLVSFHVNETPSSQRALELALATILRRKGRVLDSLTEAQRTLRDHLTPPLRDQLDQLAQARSELAAQLYATVAQRASRQRPAAIATLRTRIDDLEAALSAASTEFRAQNEPVTLANVQAALPPGAMLVEFVRYHRFDARVQSHQQEEHYVAYLVTSHGPPRWVPLGEAARIDTAIDAVLDALKTSVRTETTRSTLQRLDSLVVNPMRDQLTEVSHLILATDGKLNLVPFEALIDPQGHHELERYLISYLSSGRDLLRLATHRASRSPAVIVADPDYGPLPSHPAPDTMAFRPLPGIRAEAAELGRYFSTPPVTDKHATKEAFAALIGPAILHVATHGFYARDPGTTPAPGSRGTATPPHAAPTPPAQRGIYVDIDDGMAPLSPPVSSSDPAEALDRSGLAMAGANQGAGGIVTAREIAGFDWWGTQLVVLSACQTGVGAVPSGDGVYGLRRALVLAGAESQVVSLWNVNDASAHVLMRDYYGELSRGTGRAEALRQAKLHLMHQPRYAHPYYWAAFISAGDWRPLDKNTIRPQ